MLINFTTNTSSNSFSSRSNSINVVASGTWGGATLAVQVYDQSAAAWVTVYSSTADFQKNILVGSGMACRLTVSGGTGQDIDAYVLEVQSKDLHL
jgi:hypothetical protein